MRDNEHACVVARDAAVRTLDRRHVHDWVHHRTGGQTSGQRAGGPEYWGGERCVGVGVGMCVRVCALGELHHWLGDRRLDNVLVNLNTWVQCE